MLPKGQEPLVWLEILGWPCQPPTPSLSRGPFLQLGVLTPHSPYHAFSGTQFRGHRMSSRHFSCSDYLVSTININD